MTPHDASQFAETITGHIVTDLGDGDQYPVDLTIAITLQGHGVPTITVTGTAHIDDKDIPILASLEYSPDRDHRVLGRTVYDNRDVEDAPRLADALADGHGVIYTSSTRADAIAPLRRATETIATAKDAAADTITVTDLTLDDTSESGRGETHTYHATGTLRVRIDDVDYEVDVKWRNTVDCGYLVRVGDDAWRDKLNPAVLAVIRDKMRESSPIPTNFRILP